MVHLLMTGVVGILREDDGGDIRNNFYHWLMIIYQGAIWMRHAMNSCTVANLTHSSISWEFST